MYGRVAVIVLWVAGERVVLVSVKDFLCVICSQLSRDGCFLSFALSALSLYSIRSGSGRRMDVIRGVLAGCGVCRKPMATYGISVIQL